MKPYPADLLEPWPSDRGAAVLPDLPRVRSLFPRLHQEALAALDWAAETVKTIKAQDDDAVFDRLYRRGHVLGGMAALLDLPKAAHLLAVLDFALDLARSLQTFDRHSLAYVTHLLITTARGVLDDLHAGGRSERDLSDIIDECRVYLGEPLRQGRSEDDKVTRRQGDKVTSEDDKETRRQGDKVTEGPGDHGPQIAAPAAPSAASDSVTLSPGHLVTLSSSEGDDGPEELDVPAEKSGMTSVFCEEARENLAQVGHRLVELEEAPEPVPIVNDLFRSVHTVKGGARLLKIRKMEALAHRMESLLDQVRKGARPVSTPLIDALIDGRKLLEEMVDEVASRGPLRTRIGPCLATLAALETGQADDKVTRRPGDKVTESKAAVGGSKVRGGPPDLPPGTAPQSPVTLSPGHRVTLSSSKTGADSIRIPTEKLDDVLNTASEVFISRIRLASDVAAINAAIRHFKQTLVRAEEFGIEAVLSRLADANRRLIGDVRAAIAAGGGRVHPEKLAALVNRFHQELAADVEQSSLSTPEEMTLNLLSIDEVRKRLQKNVEHLEQLSSRLQTGAMSFRMVPIAQLFDRFPTQVREVARQLGKKVRLEVSGADTELDKVLINQLADPLLHILRNSIDHGIEPPEQRAAAGKPEAGHITLRAYYHGSHAVIEVVDDGHGIDTEKVLSKAIAAGLVDRDKAAALTRPEILELIFAPGLSTSDQVSTLSGRGVGMDVVKTAINQIQGNVVIESTLGQGTTIRMKLPLTLAVVGILLVRERSHQFAFPIQHVEEILTAKLAEIRRVSENTLYNHRGTTLPVTTLSSILGFAPSPFGEGEVSLVILSEGDKRVGVLIDEVLGRQEVLIKNLGTLIKKAPFVMGCTILSDSRLVLILNAWEVVNARATRPVAAAAPAANGIQAARKQHSVLIVDDSALQRNHLSAVLGQAGFTVETADNGFEGLKRIRHRRYSIFCVDAVMPLMDGFEFVERLRRLPGYQETPVFFITGRASETGRERAGHLGVRHYFQKPVDPDALIEALDRCCLPGAAPAATHHHVGV